MATMTKSEVRNGRLGQFNMQFVDFAIGTYATNGLAVDPKSFGFNTLLAAFVCGGNAASGGYHAIFDNVNKKLVVYRAPAATVTGSAVVKGGGGGEAMTLNPDSTAGVLTKAAATDRTIPIATLLGVAPAVAAAALGEVANATDLSLITVRLLGCGY